MSRRTLARTAPILDEADRFARIMEWQLFTMEQENKLWGYNPDVSWVPGDPIFPDPRTHYRDDAPCNCCDYGDEELSGYYGNAVRPMIQEFDDGDFYGAMKCVDCQVSWGRDIYECWNCGKEFPKPEQRSMEFKTFWGSHSEPLFRVERFEDTSEGLIAYIQAELQNEMGRQWREIMNRQLNVYSIGIEMRDNFTPALRRAEESMRGFASHFVIYDEGAAYSIAPSPAPVTDYRPPGSGYVANPNRSVFEQPDVVGPCWGTAALYDPLDEPVRGRVDLPANWAELRNPVPLPELPEPRDFSQMQDEIYWRAANPSIQDRRRS